jgi:hypothetical protein
MFERAVVSLFASIFTGIVAANRLRSSRGFGARRLGSFSTGEGITITMRFPPFKHLLNIISIDIKALAVQVSEDDTVKVIIGPLRISNRKTFIFGKIIAKKRMRGTFELFQK